MTREKYSYRKLLSISILAYPDWVSHKLRGMRASLKQLALTLGEILAILGSPITVLIVLPAIAFYFYLFQKSIQDKADRAFENVVDRAREQFIRDMKADIIERSKMNAQVGK